MNPIIDTIVNQLNLTPHPEGGFYKETYRSNHIIAKDALYDEFTGDRNYCTAIYFLLTSDNFSAFHRIKQDELWHFYEGSPLSVHVINASGNYTKHKIGKLIDGLQPQLLVPKGSWFASDIDDLESYALVGCTVSPGFDFDDFEMAERTNLIKAYPKHKTIIEHLTRV